MNKNWILTLLFLLTLIYNTIGQSYINDSVFVMPERNEYILNKTFQIYNFLDKRDEPANILTIGEKKKYVFIPVDYLYKFKKPLNTLLDSIFKIDSTTPNNKTYQIEIKHFTPELRKGSFIQQYSLNVNLSINDASDTNNIKEIGTLVFETTVPYKTHKNNAKKAYEELIYKWQGNMVEDLNNLSITPEAAWSFIIPNYKTNNYNYHKNLYARGVYTFGLGWYGIDADIYFSSPEAKESFTRTSGTIRYINTENYESIFFGKNNDNIFKRIGENSLFELQPKFLFGINRWKDIKTIDHELWEMFHICFSLSEMYQVNKLDQTGVTFSLGLVQDVFYIYNKIDFRFGLKLGIGLKL